MANDGTVRIGTELDKKGLEKGLSGIGGFAKKGFSVLGSTAAGAAKIATTAITGVTAALGAGATAAIKVGASFEAEMSKVAAISGATGDDLAALTEKAKEMGAKTKFSASESAQAMEYMAMAGWKTQDMLGGIEGIMNLAAASGEDLATTSDIVTDALTAFGLSASDSGHFADILAAASSNANTNVSMMGETFKYVAPVAGALGYSAEDCSVAIGLMANSGIKASQAGTSLRAILTRMAKPTDKVEAAMNDLGISITNNDGSMKSLNEIMIDLRGSFADLSESEKAQMAATIGGQEAMSGLLAIVSASDADFEKLTASINNCDGAAEQMAETMQNNLQGQITILKSSLEGLGIELYESMKEPLTDIAKSGIEAINELTEAFKSGGTKGLIEAGTKIITDVLLGIANALPNIIATATQIIQSIVDNLTKNLPQIMAAGEQILSALASGIVSVVGSLIPLAVNVIQEFLNGINENLPQIIEGGAQLLAQFISGITALIPSLAQTALNIVVNLAKYIINHVPEILAAGAEIIAQLAAGILSMLPDIAKAAIEIANSILEQITGIDWLELGSNVIQWIGDGINALFDSVPDLIKDIADSAYDFFTETDWIGMGKNLIQEAKSGIQSLFGNIPDKVKEIATNAYNNFKNVNWSELGKNLINKIVSGISGLIRNIPDKLKSIATDAKRAFTDIDWSSIGRNIINGIKNGISSMASSLVDSAVSAASNAINSVKGWLGIHSPSKRARDEIGVNMIAGVNEGIEDETPNLEKTSVKSMKSTVQAMKHSNASDFVSEMQAGAYRAAENNEMSARSKYQNNGYAPDDPDDGDIVIVNEVNVDGEPLYKKAVRKTKESIAKDQRNSRAAKGGVIAFG